MPSHLPVLPWPGGATVDGVEVGPGGPSSHSMESWDGWCLALAWEPSAQLLPYDPLLRALVPCPSQPRSDGSLVGATQARIDIFREREIFLRQSPQLAVL